MQLYRFSCIVWEGRETGNMNLTFLECLFSARLPILQMGKDRQNFYLTPASSFVAFVMGGSLDVVGFKLFPVINLTGGTSM